MPEFDKILIKELSGILNWALEGLEELKNEVRLEQCPEGKKLIDEHRLDCDHEQAFLNETIMVKSGSHTPATKLYERYKDWMLENGYNSVGRGKFIKSVERFDKQIYNAQNRLCGKNESSWYNVAYIDDATYASRFEHNPENDGELKNLRSCGF